MTAILDELVKLLILSTRTAILANKQNDLFNTESQDVTFNHSML